MKRSHALSTWALALGSALAASTAGAQVPAGGKPPVEKAATDDWQRWGGTWVRLEADGHLSCLSFDATNCAWNDSVADPKKTAWPIQPLVCGPRHLASTWKLTGYNDYGGASDRHWCRSAYASLFAKWEDYRILGADKLVAATPSGDLMCHSTDGSTCSDPAKVDLAKVRETPVHPLVCGAHHRRVHGNDGYDQPGHWCQLPKIVQRHVPRADIAIAPDVDAVSTEAWKADDEPAVIVRATLPAGRTLALTTNVRPDQLWWSSVTGGMVDVIPVGFEFGRQFRFIAGKGALDRHMAPPNWKRRRLAGDIVAAMKVTPGGRMCFFGTAADAPRDGGFIASGAGIGSSAGLRDWKMRLVTFPSSPFDLHAGPPSQANTLDPQVAWQLDDGTATIHEMLMVAARHVPIEGDLHGGRRKVSYAQGCDDDPRP
ncbi:hypothetical protein [Mitsuaria sp. GD03876]|uniref:hypothetical protein n=1 Tax=Mitsuaria sp. GD03876 TaxID=2975399 RepID=UPI00244B7D94|nr:hypothetical protein [Mitsuaria sp. GD03876]MDH0863000.1 hypothetical protein [Mitsuaria sp. GD03876]